MASDDYDNNRYDTSRYDNLRHMQRDVHEAHTNSQVAKLLSYLALLGTIIALALSGYALNKAGEAQSTANRAVEEVREQ